MSPEASTVGGDQSVEELRRELTEAREQQAATAGILAAISNSPRDPYRVFAEIAASAARLCDADNSTITQLAGDNLRLLARHGPLPTGALPLTRGSVIARAIIDKETIHVADLQVETDEYPEGSELARRLGHRSIVVVPLMRAGEAIGAITIRRSEVRPFTTRQIELLKVFADQAVIAIENTRLFEAEQASKRALQESLEYQIAISNVLGVISRSPNQLQPVMDTIANTALTLCNADDAAILLRDGERLRVTAHYGPLKLAAERPLEVGTLSGRAVLAREPVHVHDYAAAAEEFPLGSELAQKHGNRTALGIPLLLENVAIGCLFLRRIEVLPFSDQQISLLKTFADQAVIALKNTRLFEEVRARTAELTETLEYQTATSEVLNIISHSPSQIQPVLDTIVQTAERLCEAEYALILKRGDDGLYHLAASSSANPAFVEWMRTNPIRAGDGSNSGLVILEKRTVHWPDALAEPQFSDFKRRERSKARTMLGVPVLRADEVVAVLFLARTEVKPFSQKQIELVETFADQAVIAIENTRLFEAEQARTRELTESLERQTATTEVLSVISRSPGQLGPVFQTMLANAVRICEAKFGVLFRHDEGAFRSVAWLGVPIEYAEYMRQRNIRQRGFQPFAQGSLLDRLSRTRDVVQTADALAEPVVGPSAKYGGARSLVAVPMFKKDEQVGAIVIYRQEVRPFTDKQIELVKSFANQAVIAIENTRLLNELRESLQQQTATSDVLKAISRSALDLQSVLNALVMSASELCEAPMVAIHVQRDASLPGRARHGFSTDVMEALSKIGQVLGRGSLAGRTLVASQPVHIPDVEADAEYTFREFTRITGARSMLGVPLLRDGRPIGLLSLYRTSVFPFTPRQVELMATFADQAVIAIENVRLFEEIARKSRELEIASQHKSQFVANMSHELRTPLAAILGYAELIQEGFYGALPEKSMDPLTRIRSNGKHLLGLINTVLDIAKIESGQFSLNLGEYALENVVETVRTATEALAQTKKLVLKTEVTKHLPVGLGDEQRLTQVLLNLVGNAIKFTDTGEVHVTAKVVNGHFAVSVADTGPGIPEDEQTRIFEQFHQVDSSNTKAKGGTGLGLAIAKQIVEMHGGRIWVESTLGKGATFQMKLPTRAEVRNSAP
jgi:signal transduction histidine kinase